MLTKIISGGQTGADRGGLEAGKALNLATGGTMPRYFRTELGQEPWMAEAYGMKDHPTSSEYPPRTEDNVKDSDGTIIFDMAKKFSPGSALTKKLCVAYRKPCLVIKRSDLLSGPDIRSFVVQHDISILNVAGNRESSVPGICSKVKNILMGAFYEG